MVIPLLNIPFISVVLLLLAGILIGHLIWYRDRSDDEARAHALRGENGELQTALHEHKQAYIALQADLEDSRKEWEQLKFVNQQLEASHHASDQDLIELNNEISRLQQLKDQAFHDLDQERQQRRELQQTLATAESEDRRAHDLTNQLQAQVAALQAERDEAEEIAMARLADRENRDADRNSEVEAVHRDNEALRRELTDIQQTVAQMSTELAARDQHNVALSEECQRLTDLLEVRDARAPETGQLQRQTDQAKQDLRDAEETLARLQADYQLREEDITSLRHERDEVCAQLEDERTAREKIEQQISNVDQLVSQRDSALASLNALEAELETLQLELRTATADRDGDNQLAEQLAALQQQHDAVSAMLVDERSRCSKLEADNHGLSLAISESSEQAERTLQEHKQEIENQAVELETLRTELEEIAAQLSRERHQREHLQTVLHQERENADGLVRQCGDRDKTISTLTTQNEQLHKQATELQALRGEHASVKKILSDTTARIQQLVDQDVLSGEERRDLEQRIDEVNEQNARMTRQIADEAAEKEARLSQIEQLRQAHVQACADQSTLEITVDLLRDENRALQDRLLASSESDHQLEGQRQRLNKVIAQRDEAIASQAKVTREIAELRQQVEAQSRSLSSLNQQNDQLRHGADDVEQLRQENSRLGNERNEATRQLQQAAAEREDQTLRIRGLENRIDQLEARATANQTTIRNLRRERAAVLGRARQPAASIPFVNRSIPEDSGGRMRRDDVLGMVYTQPPKRKDDLKRISGIAQVLEKKLNAFGVYTYRQIMEWDSVAVAEFSKLLSFRDRIERDDWIGQARNLHFETYGRAA